MNTYSHVLPQAQRDAIGLMDTGDWHAASQYAYNPVIRFYQRCARDARA